MFNVFAFSVLTILSTVQFSLAAGFGLFAILALFSLRSEQIGKIEISYFFGIGQRGRKQPSAVALTKHHKQGHTKCKPRQKADRSLRHLTRFHVVALSI